MGLPPVARVTTRRRTAAVVACMGEREAQPRLSGLHLQVLPNSNVDTLTAPTNLAPTSTRPSLKAHQARAGRPAPAAPHAGSSPACGTPPRTAPQSPPSAPPAPLPLSGAHRRSMRAPMTGFPAPRGPPAAAGGSAGAGGGR